MMHRIRRCTLALGLAFAASGGAFAQAGDDKVYEFRVTPLPNTHQQLDMRMNMELRMDPRPGVLTMRTTMKQTVDTGPLDKDGRVLMRSELVQGQAEMRDASGKAMPAPPASPPMGFSATLDTRSGRYENISMEGEAFKALPPEAQEKTFRQMFDAMAKLEGAKLRIGESLDIPLSMNLPLPQQQAASMDGKINARYTLRRVDKGVADFDIAVQFDMAVKPDAAASAPQLEMQMRADGTGLLRLRLADRLALRNTLNMNMQMDMQAPEGMAMKMNMKMAIDATGSVRKPAAAAAKKAKKS